MAGTQRGVRSLDEASVYAEQPPVAIEQQPQTMRAELYLDSYRLTGDITCGAARRLVDALNTITGQEIRVHHGHLDDPFNEKYAARDLDLIQLHRNSILVAVPKSNFPYQPDPLEAVKKAPVLSTIVLPGFEVTGNVFQIADADPGHISLVGSTRFLPMTDVTITVPGRRTRVWRESVAIVNLARIVLYAPHVTKAQSASESPPPRNAPPDSWR